MTTKIQLDTGAMNALFPEGSEARIKLQNAVIANFAYKMQDKYINEEVRNAVREVIDFVGTEKKIGEVIRAKLDQEFTSTNRGWYNTIYTLNDKNKVADAINQYASGAAGVVREEMVNLSKEKIDSMFGYAKDRILREIDVAVNKAESDMVRRVEQRISAKMDELIRLEFARIVSGGESLVKKA